MFGGVLVRSGGCGRWLVVVLCRVVYNRNNINNVYYRYNVHNSSDRHVGVMRRGRRLLRR